MEFDEWETVKRCTINYRLQLRINFLNNVEKVSRFQIMKLRRCNQNFKFRFLVSVFPNGVNQETEGWLVVLRDVRIPKREPRPLDYGILSYTVSVVDIEGNSRFPRSFVEVPCESDSRFPKYLERSLILSRSDEFLLKDILTVRCDIHFYIDTIFSEGLIHRIIKDFLCPIPQELCYRSEAQVEDPNDVSNRCSCDPFTVYDFTHRILCLPPFHEARRRLGIPPTPSPSGSDSEKYSTGILEHVWLFDTGTAMFLLSLDKRQDGVGSRLVKASPVIRNCVKNPMKERLQKRVQFSDVSSRTFIIVLFFLEKGKLPKSPNRDFLGVYEFSHFYQMEDLRSKCAEEMVKSVGFSTEELKRISEKYSDGYLSELLVSRCHDYENSEQPRFIMYDRLDYDCYI